MKNWWGNDIIVRRGIKERNCEKWYKAKEMKFEDRVHFNGLVGAVIRCDASFIKLR